MLRQVTFDPWHLLSLSHYASDWEDSRQIDNAVLGEPSSKKRGGAVMYHTILMAVALQQWEQYNTHALAAREVAAAIARGASKHLHVLTVYTHENIGTSGLSAELAARHREDMILRTRELMERKMDEYVAPLKQKDLDVITIVQEGTPREDIVLTAARLKADLLIIGSHSKRGIFDITLGGTAQHVSRYAPCPVVLVSPKQQE